MKTVMKIVKYLTLVAAIAFIAAKILSAVMKGSVGDLFVFFISFGIGIVIGKLGNYKGAIADYDKAIKLNPKDAKAYNNRGGTKNMLGDYKGAIADWEKAIELNPSYKKVLQSRIDEMREKLK